MFLCKKLSLAEQKYSTTEKECAAIIFAVQKLKCYLDGHQKFVIQTDHNPLVCSPVRRTGIPAGSKYWYETAPVSLLGRKVNENHKKNI
ncbi:retrovirus-related Pol polyprotein from transposon 17.6 [Trichonephila clavipes]|nr:retrovirus-related Pol polyprotein from transposon 17.6 [Trichonephila clavipes]